MRPDALYELFKHFQTSSSWKNVASIVYAMLQMGISALVKHHALSASAHENAREPKRHRYSVMSRENKRVSRISR
jgi:hypothetical protein